MRFASSAPSRLRLATILDLTPCPLGSILLPELLEHGMERFMSPFSNHLLFVLLKGIMYLLQLPFSEDLLCCREQDVVLLLDMSLE